ncbi:hypothetical protein L917_14012 [Phytophthora nicotianae]|uniref:Uncharacterized protein n=3 Tax=Phytophthora nicotianae TaxID=4792 RepID=W2PU38_PHYN3|nr:hypothetical protein PPTG_23617 [Phytophthora nicotianae INRA-310]ETL86530.1 hypothetical protein L917_14012 [Phytophthora nicotianae]ETM39695.1 hypothetical protein L914_14138 [Phytophthora nicotianae]ETN04473.1 hypothetical protein PPTG_23617 [Phytophthora nicotianae INRA-310]ETO68438.1 hypothetical protein F444_14701 [Phytophthora nicotianae P1976]
MICSSHSTYTTLRDDPQVEEQCALQVNERFSLCLRETPSLVYFQATRRSNESHPYNVHYRLRENLTI